MKKKGAKKFFIIFSVMILICSTFVAAGFWNWFFGNGLEEVTGNVASCTGNEDCSYGTACSDNNQCKSGICDRFQFSKVKTCLCANDNDCPQVDESTYCNLDDNGCYPKKKDVGDTCSTNSDCSSGYCKIVEAFKKDNKNACECSVSNNNADCKEGYTCQQILPSTSDTLCVKDSCTVDSDCNIAGECLWSCEDHLCKAKVTYWQGVYSNNDCPPETNDNANNQAPAEKKDYGEACTEDSDCISNDCLNSKCACDFNYDCPNNLPYCHSNVCEAESNFVEPSCSNNADCWEGYQCVDGACHSGTELDLVVYEINGLISGMETALNEEDKKASGIACTEDAECLSDNCVGLFWKRCA